MPTPALNHIHILGVGNIGAFLAHSLRSLPSPPPITLLLRPYALSTFLENPRITLHDAASGVCTVQSSFDAAPSHIPPAGGVRNLIVATKAHQTLSALLPLRPAISGESTVVLVQNGMPPAVETLFPDPATRPRVLGAVVTHGVYTTAAFSITLAGRGAITLGSGGGGGGGGEGGGGGWVERELERVGALLVTPQELQKARVLKLGVNAAINALGAIHGVRNGELLAIPGVEAVMREVVEEVEGVVGEWGLWGAVEEVLKATAGNWCSMLQDLRAGRRTEVGEINGWVVEMAKGLGVRCAVNEGLVRRVRELEEEAKREKAG